MSATNMLTNPRTLIPAFLLASLVAASGLAAADVNVGGLVDVQADAHANVDASGATDLAQTTLADAQAHAAQAKADASAKADAAADATLDAKAHAETGLAGAMHAFGGWIRSLFGAAQDAKAQVHAEAQVPAIPAPPQPDVGVLASIAASFQALIH